MSRPTLTSSVARLTAAATSPTVSPRAWSAPGSSVTRASSRRPPCNTTSATPGSRASSGRSWSSARSRSSAWERVLEVSEKPTTGNTAGLMRRASSAVPEGS